MMNKYVYIMATPLAPKMQIPEPPLH